MFDTDCTNCGAHNQSPPHYKGQTIKCTTCGGRFVALERGERIFTFHCSACRGSIEAEEQMKGAQATCPHCNQDIRVAPDPLPIPTKKPVTPTQASSNSETQTLQDTSNKNPSNTNSNKTKMKEYKVLSQKDKWFGGKFDPEKLEQAINSYAAQHWRVISCATAQIPSLTGNREEMIVILERDK